MVIDSQAALAKLPGWRPDYLPGLNSSWQRPDGSLGLFTTADLAKALDVPAPTIRRWAAEQGWPRTTVGGRTTYTAFEVKSVLDRLRKRIEAENRRAAPHP
jgi:hypothetical protein